MKKKYFNILLLVGVVIMGLMVSCTKEGPAGPAGADGTDGINGSDGTDGVDGNVSCLQCHTLAIMNEIEDQYAESGHAAGYFVGYAGGRQSCAMCHSNEGFLETRLTGRDTTAASIPIPTTISCGTCHDSHVTFDFEVDGYVVPLYSVDPVELYMYRAIGQTVNLDLGDNSNLCINCHQPRTTPPVDDGTGNFTITSPYWGPHHGPQSTVLEGIGGYEIGTGYPTSGTDPHRMLSSCVKCHMFENSAKAVAGGHTWHMSVDACTKCHSSATDMDINGKQTEIAGLIDDLGAALVAVGLLDDAGHPIPGLYPLDHAGAYYNYALVVDDRSDGVHNYNYIKTLLINSIDALQ